LLDQASDLDRLDAEVLLAEAAQRNRAWLVAHADDPADASVQRRYLDWINRRRGGEPVAYLTGWREFWSLRLRVTPDTLIPRPETELLVDAALDLRGDGDLRVLDLGTGSGAIALALASERPQWQITAVDASISALVVARENAKRLGLEQIEFVHGDWYQELEAQCFDLIVSNPPYVAADDPHLEQGDCAWEPRVALTPGGDGLQAYRQILAGVSDHLEPGGWLMVEHGFDQPESVQTLFRRAGLVDVDQRADLAGLPRLVWGRCPS
jgi:release factor glutamine methyltransferase